MLRSSQNDVELPYFSDQALRIKTKAAATDASVKNVTYSGNTASGIKKYGVIIDQVGDIDDIN